MDSHRILILYITEKSGHHHAAMALEKTLHSIDKTLEVYTIDAFDYTNPILNKIAHNTYMHVIKRRPEVWEYLYDNPDVVRRSQNFKKIIHKYNSRKLINILSEINPDIVISTQAFPCGMVADLKKHNKINIPIVGVTTDYTAHSFWYYDNVDLYIVPDESTKSKMVQSGIRDDRIKVYGIPVAPEFTYPVDRDGVFRRLLLEQDVPVILIMGGGRGLGNIKQLIYSLCRIKEHFQLVVVCGVNARLFQYLDAKSRALNRSKPIRVLEYVPNINELMSAATILISKPGGITTAEALAKELPMIIFNPLPGQERSNADFLIRNGAAIRCDRLADIGIIVSELLGKGNKLKIMANSAKNMGHPDSSFRISREVLSLIGYV